MLARTITTSLCFLFVSLLVVSIIVSASNSEAVENTTVAWLKHHLCKTFCHWVINPVRKLTYIWLKLAIVYLILHLDVLFINVQVEVENDSCYVPKSKDERDMAR